MEQGSLRMVSLISGMPCSSGINPQFHSHLCCCMQERVSINLIGKQRPIQSVFWQFLNGRIGQTWVDYVVSDSVKSFPNRPIPVFNLSLALVTQVGARMYPMDENTLLPILEVHMKGTKKNFLFRSIQKVLVL